MGCECQFYIWIMRNTRKTSRIKNTLRHGIESLRPITYDSYFYAEPIVRRSMKDYHKILQFRVAIVALHEEWSKHYPKDRFPSAEVLMSGFDEDNGWAHD